MNKSKESRPVLKRNPGRGQPRFTPTEEQRRLIKIVIGFGVSPERCRLLIRNRAGKPIAHETFRRAFAAEIEVGSIEMDAIAIAALATKVRQGDMRAIEFFMRNRMNWREHTHTDRTTTDELVIKIEHEDLERRLEARGLPLHIFGADTPMLEMQASDTRSNGSDTPTLDEVPRDDETKQILVPVKEAKSPL
jgi:hypothetical protein